MADVKSAKLGTGELIKLGDTVCAKGEAGGFRNCTVLSIDKRKYFLNFLLTGPTPFGTVWRSDYEIRLRKIKGAK